MFSYCIINFVSNAKISNLLQLITLNDIGYLKVLNVAMPNYNTLQLRFIQVIEKYKFFAKFLFHQNKEFKLILHNYISKVNNYKFFSYDRESFYYFLLVNVGADKFFKFYDEFLVNMVDRFYSNEKILKKQEDTLSLNDFDTFLFRPLITDIINKKSGLFTSEYKKQRFIKLVFYMQYEIDRYLSKLFGFLNLKLENYI